MRLEIKIDLYKENEEKGWCWENIIKTQAWEREREREGGGREKYEKENYRERQRYRWK